MFLLHFDDDETTGIYAVLQLSSWLEGVCYETFHQL